MFQTDALIPLSTRILKSNGFHHLHVHSNVYLGLSSISQAAKVHENRLKVKPGVRGEFVVIIW
jgi:hypothetical protein